MALGTIHETWLPQAACRGPEAELFFPPSLPERRDERAVREAKAKQICDECAVLEECRETALRIREQHGIWGGMTESERRRIFAAELS